MKQEGKGTRVPHLEKQRSFVEGTLGHSLLSRYDLLRKLCLGNFWYLSPFRFHCKEDFKAWKGKGISSLVINSFGLIFLVLALCLVDLLTSLWL